MRFNAIHAANLIAQIRNSFDDDSAALGAVDMTYASRDDMPCIYVDFFANGERHLADVYTDDAGGVDWVY